MDNELGANDPYNNMDSGEQDVQPDFLKQNGGGELAKAEGLASAAAAAKGGKLPGKGGGLNPLAGAAKAEGGGGLFNKGGGTTGSEKGIGKMSTGTKAAVAVAAPFVLLLLALLGIIFLIIGLPILMIGTIDYNIQRVLGFDHTTAILETVGEIVTAEMLAKGKVPKGYFNDLVANGLDVGQLTANGDFVRTDVYIANIENRDDLVASAGGFSYVSEDEGELAMLYKGKIIRADEFVAAVESDPELYAVYMTSSNIGVKYYYSKEVNDVYAEMGLSRGNFNDWETTGDYAADEEAFNEIMEKVLTDGTELVVGGSLRDEPGGAEGDDEEDICEVEPEDADCAIGTFTVSIDDGDGSEIADEVAEQTREYALTWGSSTRTGSSGSTVTVKTPDTVSDDATKRAAELLNTAVSSGEPYLAANAFIAVEEPIQRARVDGDGPVNLVMNALTRGNSVTYYDVETGEEKSTNESILETDNFRAVVSDNNYSSSEALNFGRDRVLKTTEQADKETIQKTTVVTNGKKESSSVVRNGRTKYRADKDVISKASNAITLSQADKNLENFQTVVGGNRIVEGGSYLSKTMNKRVIGAMPSDNAAIASYYGVAKDALARKDEAERATKSPFDISSPNTFMGAIVHNIAMAVLKNYGSGMTALSAVTSAGDTASKAVAVLTGNAMAYGGDGEFITMNGAACETVGTIQTEGDLYCTDQNTLSTDYVGFTFEDFKNSDIGEDIDDEGNIVEDSGFEEFVTLGMDRITTVGVKSAEVCERVRENNRNIWSSIVGFFKEMDPLYDVCSEDEIDLAVSTGAKYSFGPEAEEVEEGQLTKNKLYAAYTMYDEVKSLLSEEEPATSRLRNVYYAKHPKDNSRAGIIARRSGMTKHEAEIALAYADYLNMIANYDASDRFAFTSPVVVVDKPILQYHSDEVALNLYAWYSKQTEYDDLRTRNFVV